MSMRLSEIHPSLVHFPLALLPIAVGADTLGCFTRDRRLGDIGKRSIIGAAISAAVSGVFGLIAQEEVELDEQARRVLTTHRTLNLGLLGVMTAMSLVRVRRKTASVGYLLAGVGAVAIAGVSAYLGGKLVYSHGAGVERAHGIRGRDPELSLRNVIDVTAQAAKDLGNGLLHTARDVKRGDILPALRSAP
jgi:uncharacterized membrane protein